MVKEPLAILYVGNTERGQALRATVEPYGWHIYETTELLRALGMYIMGYPDVVIIEAVPGSSLAEEVYFHLRSVNAEPLLILADEARQEQWQGPATSTIRVLPRTLNNEELLAVIWELIESDKQDIFDSSQKRQ